MQRLVKAFRILHFVNKISYLVNKTLSLYKISPLNTYSAAPARGLPSKGEMRRKDEMVSIDKHQDGGDAAEDVMVSIDEHQDGEMWRRDAMVSIDEYWEGEMQRLVKAFRILHFVNKISYLLNKTLYLVNKTSSLYKTSPQPPSKGEMRRSAQMSIRMGGCDGRCDGQHRRALGWGEMRRSAQMSIRMGRDATVSIDEHQDGRM